jgi:hypothetical protein
MVRRRIPICWYPEKCPDRIVNRAARTNIMDASLSGVLPITKAARGTAADSANRMASIAVIRNGLLSSEKSPKSVKVR